MMKNYIKISLFSAVLLLTECTRTDNSYDKDVVVIIDITDRGLNQITPEALITHLNLDADIWQAVKLKISLITHRDYNPLRVIVLPGGNKYTDNKSVRKHKISQFKKQIIASFDSLKTLNGTIDNSVIYRNIANELNLLSASKAFKKEVIISSDLMEHSDIDFYDPKILETIKNQPETIERKLDSVQKMVNVSGILFKMIYSAGSYEDNNQYRVVSGFYKSYLSKKGITISSGIDLE